MKRKTTSIFVLLLFPWVCCPGVLWAGKMEPANFRYSASLKGEIRKGGFYRIILPAEILERCERFCRDIRIFDKEKREIPYVILDNRIPAKKTVRYPLEVISYDDQTEKTKIVLKRPSRIEPVNRLELESLDHDFNKAVTVSGSTDMKRWTNLGHEAIYDFSSRVNLQKMHITLEKNTYAYLQLIIEEGKEKGNLQSIRLKYDGMDFSTSTYTKKKLQVTRFVVFDDAESREKVTYDELKLLPSVSTDAAKRVTEIAFNTAVPFSVVEFAIDNPYYYRRIKLYGIAINRKEDLAMIKEDSLYNFPISNRTETKKRIDVSTPLEYRSYKVLIENEANPPLKVESITLRWAQKQLFFIGLDDDQEYRLFWGSPTVEEASYDIAKLIRADNWATQPTEPIQFSSIVQNPGYKLFKEKDSKTLVEKNVLASVIVLVIIVVAFFLFQLWKRTG
jgi:hypothetical protein